MEEEEEAASFNLGLTCKKIFRKLVMQKHVAGVELVHHHETPALVERSSTVLWVRTVIASRKSD